MKIIKCLRTTNKGEKTPEKDIKFKKKKERKKKETYWELNWGLLFHSTWPFLEGVVKVVGVVMKNRSERVLTIVVV